MSAVLGVALLVAAWVGSNPPGASPDEPANIVKALGAAQGQWTGDAPANGYSYPAAETRLQEQFFRDYTRTFEVPSRLDAVPTPHCFAQRPEQSAACAEGQGERPVDGRLVAGLVGPYAPPLYAVLGLPALLADDAVDVTMLARGTNAVLCLALVLGAIRTAGSRLQLAAVLLALTPMVVFLAASVSPSGLEATSAICLTSAVLSLVRSADAEAWWWVGVGGAVLAVARPLGPLWVLGAVVQLVVLAGPAGSAALVRAGGRRAAVALSAVGASALFSALWTTAALPPASAPLTDGIRGVDEAVSTVPRALRELVGVFGSLDTPLPPAAYALAALAVAALSVPALIAGSPAQRAALVLTLMAVPAVTVALEAFTQAPLGFGVQGRYVLPVAVTVPLLAGHILTARSENAARWIGTVWPSALAVTVGCLQLGAWWLNARRYAFGIDGPAWWIGGPVEWEPAFGWLPWLALAAAGAVLVCAAGLPVTRGRASVPLPA